MGTGKLSGKPDEILEGGGGKGVTLLWTSIPARGSSNSPSHFMLHGNQEKLRLVVPLGSTTDF